jgi:hypothetical protein
MIHPVQVSRWTIFAGDDEPLNFFYRGCSKPDIFAGDDKTSCNPIFTMVEEIFEILLSETHQIGPILLVFS